MAENNQMDEYEAQSARINERQLYRMITLYRKKLDSKKRAENFESAAVFSDL